MQMTSIGAFIMRVNVVLMKHLLFTLTLGKIIPGSKTLAVAMSNFRLTCEMRIVGWLQIIENESTEQPITDYWQYFVLILIVSLLVADWIIEINYVKKYRS